MLKYWASASGMWNCDRTGQDLEKYLEKAT